MDATNNMTSTPQQRVTYSDVSRSPVKTPIKKRCQSPNLERSPPRLAFFESLHSPPKELDGLSFQHVLDKKSASFGPNQKKTIYRWMWQHNTRTVKGYEFEFKMLLATLGFSDAAFSPQLTELLGLKVHRQIRRNSTKLARLGACTMVWDKQKKRKVSQFAEWTEGWMSNNWDGSPERPRWTQLFLNPYFGESRGWLHLRVPVALNEDIETPLSFERFVVAESEAISGSRHPFSNAKPKDSAETHEETQGPGKINFETFKFLCGSASTISNTNYEIDVSQLPQYHGVQLTPNDPYHPLQPDANFTAADLDCDDEAYDEGAHDGEVEYEEDIEEEHDDILGGENGEDIPE